MNAYSGVAGTQDSAKWGAGAVWGLFLLGLVLACALDYVGIAFVHLPEQAWYAVTALCFGGAGFLSGMKSSISKGGGIAAAVVTSILYFAGTLVIFALIGAAVTTSLSADAGASKAGLIAGMILGFIPGVINFAIGLGAGIGGFIQGRALAQKR